jgi:ABC-2 type transport system permease protein
VTGARPPRPGRGTRTSPGGRGADRGSLSGTHALGAGFRFQLLVLRGQADTYFSLVAAPFYTVIFLSIMEFTGRTDLNGHAVVAPMLMTVWTAALMFSGEMISEDRENRRIESLVATTASFPLLILGRLTACMLLAVPSFAVSVLVAGGLFDYWVTIEHPALFVVVLLLTIIGTAGTATALSALFVLAPSARIVQNTLTFPMFLLGGVIIPVSFLPQGVELLSRVLYLSWASDLLRATTRPETVESAVARSVMVLLLGCATLALGMVSISRFLRRARERGALTVD